MRKVEIADRCQYRVTLADGWPMSFTCDPAGLMSAYDFATEGGAVLRVERRLVELLPGLSDIDERLPSYWADSDETRKRDKALFVSLWNGMPESDKASFLEKVVGLPCERRVAA